MKQLKGIGMRETATAQKCQQMLVGEGWTEKTTRQIIPILVRQAEARMPITYGTLADEIGFPNHARVLSYPLGLIGNIIRKIRIIENHKIPQLQSIVVAKDGFPGPGFGPYANKSEYNKLSYANKRELILDHHREIWNFPKWREFLDLLLLSHPPKMAFWPPARPQGSGESINHKRLKYFIAENPDCLKLDIKLPKGEVEQPRRSPFGDSFDVLFRSKDLWVVAEAKSIVSDEADILRGIFQCVKYSALCEALQIFEGETRGAIAILALEGSLPVALIPFVNALGVRVVESITIPEHFQIAPTET